MDNTTLDNLKSSDVDSTTQVLLSNANTNINNQSEDSNGIYEASSNVNDGLNNIINVNATNDTYNFFEGKEQNLNITGQQQDNMFFPSKVEKSPFESELRDMGPETSVDATDELAMNSEDPDTDLLDLSTLSQSKETLPSSDNFNPFDSKFSPQDLDKDDFKVEFGMKSPFTPPEEELINPNSMTATCEELKEEEVHTSKDSNSKEESVNSAEMRHDQNIGEKTIESDYTNEIKKNIESNIEQLIAISEKDKFPYSSDEVDPEFHYITEDISQVPDPIEVSETDHALAPSLDTINESEDTGNVETTLPVNEFNIEMNHNFELEKGTDKLNTCYDIQENIENNIPAENNLQPSILAPDNESDEKVQKIFKAIDTQDDPISNIQTSIETTFIKEDTQLPNEISELAESLHDEENLDKKLHDSCDESEDEWNYMKNKKGEGEKEKIIEDTSISGEKVKSTDTFVFNENIDNEISNTSESQESKELIERSLAEEPSDIIKSEVEQSEQLEQKKSDSLDNEVEDMTSQLNPEAKEFIPTTSPVFDVPSAATVIAHCFNGDDVVAQSPRKGAISMDDIQVPSENEFEFEIAHRPSEIEEANISNEPYQEMNLKEAMHASEKEEQASPDELYGNSTFETADMRTSIYVENTLNKMEDVMNTVQALPVDSDDVKDYPSNLLEEKNKNLIPEMASKNELNLSFRNDSTTEEVTDHITPLSNISTNEMLVNDLVLNGEKEKEKETIGDQLIEDQSISLKDNFAKDSAEVKFSKVITDAPKLDLNKVEENNKKVKLPNLENEKKIEMKGVKSKVDTTKQVKHHEIKKTELKTKPTSTTLKKVTSSVSTSDNKLKTAQVSKAKSSAPLGLSRPRTAPVSSKTSLTDKKSTNNITATRPKTETRVAAATTAKKISPVKSKIDTTLKPTASKVGITSKSTTTSRTGSSTSTTPKRSSTTATSNSTASRGITQRSTLSPSGKSAHSTASKPSISPRSTLTSTLRKTEAIKSPTTGITRVTSSSRTTTTTTRATTKPVTLVHKTMTATTTTRKTSTSTLASNSTTKLVQKKSPIKKITNSITEKNVKLEPINADCNNSELKINGSINVENKE